MTMMVATPRVLQQQSVYTKQDSWSDKSVWRFCAGVFLIVLSGLFYIGIHVQGVEIGYKINAQQKIKQELINQNKALSAEIAVLKSPERLEKIATEQLGLAVPREKQFVYFNMQPVITASKE